MFDTYFKFENDCGYMLKLHLDINNIDIYIID